MRPVNDSVGPSLREAKKRENRKAFLEAGRRVFSEIGLGAATVRDIVRESGLAQGSFYNYFDSKEAVFEVIVDSVVEQIRARLRESREAAIDGPSFLIAGYRACMELTAFDPDTAALMRRNQNAFRAAFYQNQTASGLLADLVEELDGKVASGVFRPHDSAVMAETMISLGVDLIITCLDAPDEAPRRLDFLQDLFANALLADGALDGACC